MLAMVLLRAQEKLQLVSVMEASCKMEHASNLVPVKIAQLQELAFQCSLEEETKILGQRESVYEDCRSREIRFYS